MHVNASYARQCRLLHARPRDGNISAGLMHTDDRAYLVDQGVQRLLNPCLCATRSCQHASRVRALLALACSCSKCPSHRRLHSTSSSCMEWCTKDRMMSRNSCPSEWVRSLSSCTPKKVSVSLRLSQPRCFRHLSATHTRHMASHWSCLVSESVGVPRCLGPASQRFFRYSQGQKRAHHCFDDRPATTRVR